MTTKSKRKCSQCGGSGVIEKHTGLQYCAGCDTAYPNDFIIKDTIAGRSCPKGHAGYQIVPEVKRTACKCGLVVK